MKPYSLTLLSFLETKVSLQNTMTPLFWKNKALLTNKAFFDVSRPEERDEVSLLYAD